MCEQRGATAVCTCDAGFVDDGLEHCARCADPLFRYPDCQVRSWILEEPDISCDGLEYRMPRSLYQADKSNGHGEALQQEDGVLNWAQRYRLVDRSSRRQSSTHTFMVPTNSVFRLFLDTSRSGVLVRYRLLDDELQELLSSNGGLYDINLDGFVESGSEVTLLHQPNGKDPAKAPFTLQLDYRHAAEAWGGYEEEFYDQEDSCAVLDIRLIVEPLLTAEAALQCTETELTRAAEERQSNWEFDQ